jgi:hypothetical protein
VVSADEVIATQGTMPQRTTACTQKNIGIFNINTCKFAPLFKN